MERLTTIAFCLAIISLSLVGSTPRNMPPTVRIPISKLNYIAGNVYRLRIRPGTFYDLEDGDTPNLRLIFKTQDNDVVGRNSWIQLNPRTQEIYAMPLEENIGRWVFFLEATDSEGASTVTSIPVQVQQAREARVYNHMYTATFKVKKAYERKFRYPLDWKILVVKKIAEFYNDGNIDNINVRTITTNPLKLTWTNASLADPGSLDCPTNELDTIGEAMISGDGNEMTPEIKKAFLPEFRLKQIHASYIGPCERFDTRPRPDPVHEIPEGVHNERPFFRNPTGDFEVTQGSFFRFQVPADTCYDLEDGDTRRLSVRLLLMSNVLPPPPDHWLQFDAANQELFGIPLDYDVGMTDYILECMDSSGAKVNDAVRFTVLGWPSQEVPPAVFSIQVDADYIEFMMDPHQKARLIQRIGLAFDNEDPDHIVIDSLYSGSMGVQWHNGSLPSDPCPYEEISDLAKVMVDQRGNLLQEFIDVFAPDFKVIGGSVTLSGSCLARETPIAIVEETEGDFENDSIIIGSRQESVSFITHKPLTLIIPSVAVAITMLMAAIVAYKS